MKAETEIGRYELKYLVPEHHRSEITRFVERHANADPHARPLADGTLGYQVHSLYFDTPRLDDYFERLERRRIRNRLRIRTYGDAHEAPPVFLENKRKSDAWVVKHRLRLADTSWFETSGRAPWRSLWDHCSASGTYAARSFRQLVGRDRRLPITVVHYDREVFVARHGCDRRIRLTLDRRVRAAATNMVDPFHDHDSVELVPPRWLVLEMKFQGAAPGWMTELRRQLEITSVPISKFGLSVAMTIRAAHQRELRSLLPPPLLRNHRHRPDTALAAPATAFTRSIDHIGPSPRCTLPGIGRERSFSHENR